MKAIDKDNFEVEENQIDTAIEEELEPVDMNNIDEEMLGIGYEIVIKN